MNMNVKRTEYTRPNAWAKVGSLHSIAYRNRIVDQHEAAREKGSGKGFAGRDECDECRPA